MALQKKEKKRCLTILHILQFMPQDNGFILQEDLG